MDGVVATGCRARSDDEEEYGRLLHEETPTRIPFSFPALLSFSTSPLPADSLPGQRGPNSETSPE